MGNPPSSTLPSSTAPAVPLLYLAGLTLFCALFFMLGPPVTLFTGLAWLPRPGSRYLIWLGSIFMVLHIAGFIFMMAMPSWYHPAPQVQ